MPTLAQIAADEALILADLPKNATAKIEKRKAGVSSIGEPLQQWDMLASAHELHMGAKAASIQTITAGQRQLTTYSATMAALTGLDISCRFTISGAIYNVRAVKPSFAGVFQTVELVEVD